MAEVFFSDGDWKLVKSNSLMLLESGHSWSTIQHKCGWLFKPDRTMSLMALYKGMNSRPRCYKCKEQIPDSLMGLWKLHNWEGIQDVDALKVRSGSVAFYLSQVIKKGSI